MDDKYKNGFNKTIQCQINVKACRSRIKAQVQELGMIQEF